MALLEGQIVLAPVAASIASLSITAGLKRRNEQLEERVHEKERSRSTITRLSAISCTSSRRTLEASGSQRRHIVSALL